MTVEIGALTSDNERRGFLRAPRNQGGGGAWSQDAEGDDLLPRMRVSARGAEPKGREGERKPVLLIAKLL